MGTKLRKRIDLRAILCLFLVLIFASCAVRRTIPGTVTQPPTRTYIEYSRGKSFPTRSDISLKYYNNYNYRFHGVYLEDESFFPDDSILPNAFFSPLFDLRFGDALDAFTEPYYSIRLIHFLKKNPRLGIGLELIHLKVFLMDKEQSVRMTGVYDGVPVDGRVRIGDYLDLFNVSHGVNHVSLLFNYRWLLAKTPRVPDGRLQPFASFSLGPAVPHLELDLKKADKIEKKAYSYQWGWGNWGMGMGLGLRYKPNRRVGFYLEYKFTYSYLHDMYFDDDLTARVMMNFFTHHLQWGISIML